MPIDDIDDIPKTFEELKASLSKFDPPQTLDDYMRDFHYEFPHKTRVCEIGPFKGLTELEILCETGAFDRVIMTAEVTSYERKHGEPTDDTAPPSSWPWGDYETPLLRILAEAVDHFCVKNDLDRYPKKESGVVVDWIMDRMKTNGMPTGESLPSAMETLIAPRPYVHHRQRKQGKA